MVKLTQGLMIAALTIASSSSLAAPMPLHAPESDAMSPTLDESPLSPESKKEEFEAKAEKSSGKQSRVVTNAQAKEIQPKARTSATDNIRRGIPLLPGTSRLSRRQNADDTGADVPNSSEGSDDPTAEFDANSSDGSKAAVSGFSGSDASGDTDDTNSDGNYADDQADRLEKRAGDLVSSLGLAGTLAPLGLQNIVPTVQGTVNGLPVVGPPVAGVVKTVDQAVGVTPLLGGKPQKRDAVGDATAGLNGLLGNLGGLGGLLNGVTGTANQATSNPLAVLGQLQGQLGGLVPGGLLSGGGLPLSGLLGQQAQGQAQAQRQLDSLIGQIGTAVPSQAQPQTQQITNGLNGLTIGQLSGLLSGLGGNAQSTVNGVQANVPAAVANPLAGITVAQAQALGVLNGTPLGAILGQAQSTVQGANAASLLGQTPLASILGNSPLAGVFAATPDASGADISNGTTPSNGTDSSLSDDQASPLVALTLPPIESQAQQAAVPSPVEVGQQPPASVAPSNLAGKVGAFAFAAIPSDAASASSSSMTFATVSSVAPGATPTGNTFAAVDADSGSDYSGGDSDEDDDDASAAAQAKSDAWKVAPSSASKMAATYSQAVATSQAMDMSESNASEVAAPTTVAGMNRERSLD